MAEALCPHFGVCGGCTMQDRSDAEVAAWKRGLVEAALNERGLEADIRAVHTSPSHSRRRAVLSGRRTKKTTQLGFFGRRSDVLVPITDCAVVDPRIMDAWDGLHRIVRAAASRSGTVRLAVTVSDAGLDVAASNARARDARLDAMVGDLAHGLARLSWNGELLVQHAAPVQRFGQANVVPPAGGFLQATKAGEAAIQDAVRRAVGNAAPVLDLFAGAGTLALALADRAEVHAVEADGEALDALDAGWRNARDLRAVTTERRDLFRRPLLGSELTRFRAVVLDPPRAGAAAQVEEIAGSTVGRLAYVSCNPASFARDAGRLAQAGFGIDWIQVIDQFRWSNHVELVAGLTRR